MTDFAVTLKHDELGEVRTTVETKATDCFHDHFDDMVSAARKNAASKFIDYETFSTDSGYLEKLDALGQEFTIVKFKLLSQNPLVRYLVRGDYSSDERGEWEDYVFARSAADAIFQARWIMAANEGARPNEPDFSGAMDEIYIRDFFAEPLSLDEAKAFMSTIARMIISDDPEFTEESDQSNSEALYELVRIARKMLAGKHLTA